MAGLMLVGGTGAQRDSLALLLRPLGFERPQTAEWGSEAIRLASQSDFDLILINTPLSDEFGKELAVGLVQRTTASVILLVRADIGDQVASEMEPYGILVLTKPLNRPIFLQSVRFVMATRARIAGFKRENTRLQDKIEEIRLVDRAKCALIQYLGMSEATAHRYIEKQAMDLRKTKVQIAEGILKTNEA